MRLHQDRYIHELTTEAILTLLKNGAWQTGHQTITSAVTNDNDLKEPDAKWMAMGENTAGTNAFSDIKFDTTVKRVLDVGGGKYDCNCNYMKRTRGIELLVWDPYNRSHSHNAQIQKEVMDTQVDAATSMSVLNVIPEPEVRIAHIATLKTALKMGGKAYFKIWAGEFPLQGSYLPSATATYYQANAYADRFLREIEIVFGINNVKVHESIPNLMVAIKMTDQQTKPQDIVRIQKKSQQELILLTKLRAKSVNNLNDYSKNNLFKLFATNLNLLKKMEDDFLERNRHADPRIQHAYDTKYGLVPYKG